MPKKNDRRTSGNDDVDSFMGWNREQSGVTQQFKDSDRENEMLRKLSKKQLSKVAKIAESR